MSRSFQCFYHLLWFFLLFRSLWTPCFEKLFQLIKSPCNFCDPDLLICFQLIYLFNRYSLDTKPVGLGLVVCDRKPKLTMVQCDSFISLSHKRSLAVDCSMPVRRLHNDKDTRFFHLIVPSQMDSILKLTSQDNMTGVLAICLHFRKVDKKKKRERQQSQSDREDVLIESQVGVMPSE